MFFRHDVKTSPESAYYTKSGVTTISKEPSVPTGASCDWFLPFMGNSDDFPAAFIERLLCFIVHETTYSSSCSVKQVYFGSLPWTRTKNNTVNSRAPLPIGAVGNNSQICGCPSRDRTYVDWLKTSSPTIRRQGNIHYCLFLIWFMIPYFLEVIFGLLYATKLTTDIPTKYATIGI